MLSYMVPAEEKPPPMSSSGSKTRLQLELSRCRAALPPPPPPPSALPKDSSTSSFTSSTHTTASSMTPTGQLDKPKHKLLTNGTKHTTLKRVSFGSSKGSMVETLIYESPLQEEVETKSPVLQRLHETTFLYTAPEQEECDRAKVRVSFYQGARPQCLSPPALEEYTLAPCALLASTDADMAATILEHPVYNRQISTESGWDNPFRPDGDLSREADEIVSQIKRGKPITPTPGAAPLPALDETDLNQSVKQTATNTMASSVGVTNGTKNGTAVVERGGGGGGAGPGMVEVQRSAPQEPQQPERVTLKKKPKCKCCVVQ